MKRIPFALIILIAIGLGTFFAVKSALTWNVERVTKEESTTLLEQVKTVAKLVTVEGEFSEIYSHEDYYWQNISLFRKKALLKVKAKVGIGYDLSQYQFDMKSLEKKMVVKKLAKPEIIFIETDMSYYDLQEGTFNSFKPAELTDLQQKAKGEIEKKALASSLLQAAENQASQIEDLIRLIVEQAGWTVEFREKEDDGGSGFSQ